MPISRVIIAIGLPCWDRDRAFIAMGSGGDIARAVRRQSFLKPNPRRALHVLIKSPTSSMGSRVLRYKLGSLDLAPWARVARSSCRVYPYNRNDPAPTQETW